jgi:hypothetical protein
MVRNALLKLLGSLILFMSLLLGIFSSADRGMVGIMGGLLVVVVAPITILLSIDASRTIRQQSSGHRSLRLFGILLGIPQAVMGIVLIAFGLVYPFFGIRGIVEDVGSGRSGSLHLVTTVTALVLLFVGFHYLREGLGFKRKNHDSD